MPAAFTARELAKALFIPPGGASAAASVLCFMGAIRQVGARGRAFLYAAAETGP